MASIFAARRLFLSLALLLSVLLMLAGAMRAQDQPDGSGRIVIGNSVYPARPLATAANDAGLIAEMLRNADYDIVEARDADEAQLRQKVREFLDKVSEAGPEAVAFVYLSGYGLQFEGENYFVPVSARLARATDIPSETFRIGDLLRSLQGINAAARMVVLDIGREHPFLGGARAVPPGLLPVEPPDGMLVAFSTGPGEIMRDAGGNYGAYASAFAEMAVKPGITLDRLFTQIRLRVHELSRGAITPWYANRISAPVIFFESEQTPADPNAPPQLDQPDPAAEALLGRPLRTMSPQEAYGVVIQKDTIEAYEEFLATFPGHPLARRVQLLLAERREARIWRRTVSINTPEAYWSYLQRYPRGPHAFEARRRLAALTAPVQPPPGFAMLDYDVPPPPPDEVVFFDTYYETYYAGWPPDYAPPPPFAPYFLPPADPVFYSLPPPVFFAGVALAVPAAIMMRRAIRPARPPYVLLRRPGPVWAPKPVIRNVGGQPRLRTTPGVQPPIRGVQPATKQPLVVQPLPKDSQPKDFRKQEFKKQEFKKEEFKKQEFKKQEFKKQPQPVQPQTMPPPKQELRKQEFKKQEIKKQEFKKQEFKQLPSSSPPPPQRTIQQPPPQRVQPPPPQRPVQPQPQIQQKQPPPPAKQTGCPPGQVMVGGSCRPAR
jgi:uncharacterized caspase-like protein